MPSPPALFDTELLTRRRARAAAARADFLHEAVAGEIAARLKQVNRVFRAGVVIGPRAELWVRILAAQGVRARAVPDAEVYQFAAGAQDLVAHGLAMHWANDPVGQLVQARRALAPDGLFLGALFGGETLHELRAALAHAESEALGGLSPRIAPMGEIRGLGGLLQRAGFALPVADSRRYDVSYPTPLHLMRDLRAMGETNVMRDRLRRPMRRAMLARAVEIYAARFGLAGGRTPATFEVIYLTGWAPSPDQQRALRPGSARRRLADALGAPERGAGDSAGAD